MDPLPDNIRRLVEELLAIRSLDAPPDLRGRVLRRVQQEIASESLASGGQGRWTFAAALAASVLFLMNLSIGATTATESLLRFEPDIAEIDRLAAEITELLPEMSLKEARLQAVRMSAGQAITPVPELPTPSITRSHHNALTEFLELRRF